MGSDDPTGDGGPKVGVAVTYTALDEEEARRVFEALADGGQVFMAFEPTFFSKGFGSCMDRWGVNWMVDTQGDVPA
ncbi:MAG: VOC family protein, partial [Acidimicrobiia bacterium]